LAAEVTMLMEEEMLGQAEVWLRQAIAADELRGLSWQLARDHAAVAELRRLRGDRTAMYQSLDRAGALFAECGAGGWARMMEERKTLESSPVAGA
jgi:hypothetical protein